MVVAIVAAIAAGPIFGRVTEANNGASSGFRALSGGRAANFVMPGDMELVRSFYLAAYDLTYERYQQFFGNSKAEVLGG